MHETDYQSILSDIHEAIQQCGTLARDAFYSQDPEQPVSGKASIDVVIERKLHEALTARTPLFGFISEECPELAKAPSDHLSHYWLVDPNDGTKPFQEGYRGSSISVALIRGDVPVLGVVYAYAARCGVGDLYEWCEGGALRRNGLYVQWQRANPVALVSNNAELKHAVYQEQFAPLRYQLLPASPIDCISRHWTGHCSGFLGRSSRSRYCGRSCPSHWCWLDYSDKMVHHFDTVMVITGLHLRLLAVALKSVSHASSD